MVASGICHWVLKGQKSRNPAIPENPKTIGERIRKYRIENGLSQKEIAEQVGVRTDSVTNWELGRNEPQIQFMPKIIKLLGDSGEKESNQNEVIRKFRESLGLSRRKFSLAIGIDDSTLAKIESGIHTKRLQSKVELTISYIQKNSDKYNTFEQSDHKRSEGSGFHTSLMHV